MSKSKDNKKKATDEVVEEKGLGDMVKETIKKVAPKVAEKYEDCEDCEERRVKLNKAGRYLKNNINAIFG